MRNWHNIVHINSIYEMASVLARFNKAEKRRKIRLEILNKFNGHCAYCGDMVDFDGFHTDHIKPKKRYKVYGGDCYSPRWHYGEDSGGNELENLFPCCQSCNSCKSDLSLEEFRERILDRVIRLNQYSSEYQIAKRFGLIEEVGKSIVFYFETLKNG